MVIPEGMSESEVMNVIQRVMDRYTKFSFGIYSEDDIKQEVFIICNDAMQSYDGKRPLENYLSIVARNRLIDLHRQKNSSATTKFLLNYPIPIDHVDEENESSMYYVSEAQESLEKEEFEQKVNDRIPIEYRMDYIKLKSGIKISKIRRQRILDKIREIIETEDLDG